MEDMNLDSKRSTNIELLRIVAMIMIVAHHFAVHGGFSFESVGFNAVFVDILAIGGKVGVNIFFLIMGFFSFQKEIKPHKILSLIGVITLYSICLYAISAYVGTVEFRKKELVYALLPVVVGGGYWFTTTYIEVYAFTFFLNKIINQVEKKQHIYLICVGLLLFSILPFTLGQLMKLNNFGYSGFLWFLIIYCIGAFIGKYEPHKKWNNSILCWGLVGSALAFVFFRIIASIGVCNNKWLSYIVFMASDYNENAIFVLIISILMFLVCLKFEIKYSRFINSVAATTFGVYLLHDNKNFSTYLWEEICGTVDMQLNDWFPFYAVACILIVFFVCSGIEMLRITFFRKIGIRKR